MAPLFHEAGQFLLKFILKGERGEKEITSCPRENTDFSRVRMGKETETSK